MSRHDVPAILPHHTAVVGWDRPMGTFFGQVHDTRIDDEASDPVVLWIGADGVAVPTVEGLAQAMAAYVVLTPDTLAALRADRERQGFRHPPAHFL